MITRFAPSPTGHLHFGNLRTALFNWLAAKAAGGSMQLRLEDTDDSRNQEQYVDSIKADLAWLGIDWQGTPTGEPWRQSQRQADYEQQFSALQKNDAVYPCFCKVEELVAERKVQLATGCPPRYSGRCARIGQTSARARLAAGDPAAWRFRLAQPSCQFDDLVGGRLTFDVDRMGDFIIRRTNGSFAFLFVNAVDDALLNITHVLRGEDHIANTPRQLILLSALALRKPQYGHVGLMVNADGQPLSKRSGLTPVREWRRQGFLPSALINYLAGVGHHYPPTEETLLAVETLAARFSLLRLKKKPAQYDENQLKKKQKEAVMQLSTESMSHWLGKSQLSGIDDVPTFCQLVRENVLLPDDAALWRQVVVAESLPYDNDAMKIISKTTNRFYLLASQQTAASDWSSFCTSVSQATGQTGKSLFLPLRTALTSYTKGPAMPLLFQLLTHQQRQQRLLNAATLTSA